jgi:hypothetical protein
MRRWYISMRQPQLLPGVKQVALDLCDKCGEIGAGEAEVGGRDAVMLNVRRNMFMVRGSV